MFGIYLNTNISSATWDSCRNILISESMCFFSYFSLIFVYGIRPGSHQTELQISYLFVLNLFNRGVLVTNSNLSFPRQRDTRIWGAWKKIWLFAWLQVDMSRISLKLYKSRLETRHIF